MLKLVKYDFRRNRDQILALFVVTILAQIGVGFTRFTESEIILFNIMVYLIAVVILFFFALRTYDYNLKSYNRRLLPLQVLYTVLSPLLLFLGLLLGIFIVAYIHLGVHIMMYSSALLPANFWSVSSYVVLALIWASAFAMLLIMFSITVARSIRMKGSMWVGLVTFFIAQKVISLIEDRIFNHTFISLDSAFRFEVTNEVGSSNRIEVSDYTLGLLPMLFEVVIAVLLIAVIIKLIKKRVES
jgi:hypothetical protein